MLLALGHGAHAIAVLEVGDKAQTAALSVRTRDDERQVFVEHVCAVATEGDGTQFDLVREENGWLMTPGDVSSLQECLEDAFSDCARLRRFGLEGYRIVDEELNLERMIDEFVIALTSIRSAMSLFRGGLFRTL